ncbi:DUF3515 domain-containing protein [Micromonospora sp. CPCC 206061]|uniref:DUF3515 domain-containing protein n=1 Tax=Micromonospora sp. CPCC 206061 TaxID=3122410 RepID=UPI002FF404DE
MDRTTRQAALWATAVALPITALVAVLAIRAAQPDPVARPTPSATAPSPTSTTPVEMAAPALPERAATVCRALLSRLPATVQGMAQRPVTAGAEQNAAYGDPAVTVACGVPAARVPPTAELFDLDQVCWYQTAGDEATVWTTVDREVPVRVTVPKAYDPPGQKAIAFSDAIVATVPSRPDAPSGCA